MGWGGRGWSGVGGSVRVTWVEWAMVEYKSITYLHIAVKCFFSSFINVHLNNLFIIS